MGNNPLDDLIEDIGNGFVDYPTTPSAEPDVQTVESIRQGWIPDQLVDEPMHHPGRVEVPVEHDGHAGKFVVEDRHAYYSGAARAVGGSRD